MNDSKELMTTNNQMMTMDFDTVQRVSKAMVSSGYFSDARDVAQAIVKVMAGQEMGLGPFASMTGIHVIKGKPVLGANLIATLIKNDPRYDYRIGQLDSTGCTLTFYEGGREVGQTSFTAQDAKAAGLTGGNWQKYPRNMYFARAISNGAKWYAPGIFGGAPIYTPEELGADIDQDGDIIDITPEPVTEPVITHESVAAVTESPDPVSAANDLVATATESPTAPTNGKPEPLFNGNIADARAWLQEKFDNDRVLLGLVADALCMTGHYNDRKHVLNWLNGAECQDLRDAGLKVDSRAKVSDTGAMTIFDRAVERKKDGQDG